jgi:hypothetical protein
MERSMSFECMQRESEKKKCSTESRKYNSEIKKSRSTRGKTRNMGISCNGKWLVVGHIVHY